MNIEDDLRWHGENPVSGDHRKSDSRGHRGLLAVAVERGDSVVAGVSVDSTLLTSDRMHISQL